jgi:hypothetical protein
VKPITQFSSFIPPPVYVDDIVITGDDLDGIQQLIAHLFKNF